MSAGYETIAGHRYWVERDDKGNIISQVGADLPPVVAPDPVEQRVALLLKANSLTAAEQQELMKAIAKKLYGR